MKNTRNRSPAPEQTVELGHFATLLDVVFGVVIAIPLTNVPKEFSSILQCRTVKSAVPLLMLLSALVFSLFYWLENRHFIDQKKTFEDAVQEIDGKPPLSLQPGFALAGLLMMILAAAALWFAQENQLRRFLFSNLAFWFCDFVGTGINRHRYKPQTIHKVIQKSWDDYGWFWGHIGTNYFQRYGAINMSIFAAALIVDYLWTQPTYQFIISAFLLLFTIFRHAFWRSGWYNSWLQRKYRKKFSATVQERTK